MNREDSSGWCYRKQMNSAVWGNEDHIWQPLILKLLRVHIKHEAAQSHSWSQYSSGFFGLCRWWFTSNAKVQLHDQVSFTIINSTGRELGLDTAFVHPYSPWVPKDSNDSLSTSKQCWLLQLIFYKSVKRCRWYQWTYREWSAAALLTFMWLYS